MVHTLVFNVAGEKIIWTIDIGNLSGHAALKYVQKVRKYIQGRNYE